MRLLLDDRLAPLTSALHFIEADLELIVTRYLAWHEELEQSRARGVTQNRRPVAGPLESALESLFPLTSERRRVLFVPTKSNWVVYFENIGLADPGTVQFLTGSNQLNCRGIRADATPHTFKLSLRGGKGQLGAVIFVLYSGHLGTFPTHTLRSVQLIHDAFRWEFSTYGEPLSFEDVKRYKAFRKRDRFTIEMLDDYLQNLGISAFDENFYLPPEKNEAILVEKVGPMFPGTEEFTLSEIRKRMGIDPKDD